MSRYTNVSGSFVRLFYARLIELINLIFKKVVVYNLIFKDISAFLEL